MEIRDAVPADAAAACEVIRRSITELCVADHRNEPAILARWLANKTSEIVGSWIAQADSSMLVAVEGARILAVGSVNDKGEVTLNYVSPDARFRGVSRTMLRALETRAIDRDNARCTLFSTETARRFYREAGYVEDGAPQGKFGTSSGYPMSKRLDGARLERVIGELPPGFEALRVGAQAEGYRHLDRLTADWATGAIRFNGDDEALLVAYVGSHLAGIGGLTGDPVIPDALRMRRFYVGKRFRQCGIGRQLAAALLKKAASAGRRVTVNAAGGSAPFWEALGFVADERHGHTHVLKRATKSE
jgi:GNAT superfamily N-acetyltransferase